MVFLRLFCYVAEINFDEISGLNVAKNEGEFNRIICRIIGLLEKNGYADEAPLIVQMLCRDQNERLHIDKILPLFKTKFL